MLMEVVVWDCVYQDHRHRTRAAAQKCLDEMDRDPMRNLTVRSANALMGQGLVTVEDIQEYLREHRLTDIPKIGAKSAKEIMDFLAHVEKK